jgi:uncharacterized protein with PQ loop repeat
MSGAFSAMTNNLAVTIPILVVLVAALVVYLVLMVRAILDMLRRDVHVVLLTFAFLALIAVPLFVIMGIMVLIIWHHHKKDLLVARG